MNAIPKYVNKILHNECLQWNSWVCFLKPSLFYVSYQKVNFAITLNYILYASIKLFCRKRTSSNKHMASAKQIRTHSKCSTEPRPAPYLYESLLIGSFLSVIMAYVYCTYTHSINIYIYTHILSCNLLQLWSLLHMTASWLLMPLAYGMYYVLYSMYNMCSCTHVQLYVVLGTLYLVPNILDNEHNICCFWRQRRQS